MSRLIWIYSVCVLVFEFSTQYSLNWKFLFKFCRRNFVICFLDILWVNVISYQVFHATRLDLIHIPLLSPITFIWLISLLSWLQKSSVVVHCIVHLKREFHDLLFVPINSKQEPVTITTANIDVNGSDFIRFLGRVLKNKTTLQHKTLKKLVFCGQTSKSIL